MPQEKQSVTQCEREAGLVYLSPAIVERRRRILAETRKMIAQRGLAAFSMDDLSKQAGVAKRTLYNAYQTKERMIAMAIHETWETYVEDLPFTAPVGSVRRNVERIVFFSQRHLHMRNYISALTSIYFSQEIDRSIRSTMHKMAVDANLEWINPCKAKRQLQPWVDVSALADDIARTGYAVMNDWCAARYRTMKSPIITCAPADACRRRYARRGAQGIEELLQHYSK